MSRKPRRNSRPPRGRGSSRYPKLRRRIKLKSGPHFENLEARMMLSSVPFAPTSEIGTAVDGAVSVFSADVDGDGDLDVLSASLADNKIAWYENTAGDGSAFSAHTISSSAAGARAVYAADVDGDGDLDVLSASRDDNTIAWYENTAGDGSVFTTHTITTSAAGAISVYAADVDGDGDLDVLSASRDDNTVAWYENTAGDGSAFTPRVISSSAVGARWVYAADVDGDGDTDVLSASASDDTIAWHENTAGDGSAFTLHVISNAADGAWSVQAADVDGDGDLDVLSTSANDDTVAWYENTAGDGSAFTPHVISSTGDRPHSVHATDVDGDGDLDVLAASYSDNTIAWYENTAGDGSVFVAHTVTTSADGAWSVFAADLDGDGDTDVLSASTNDDTVAWYENRGGQFALRTGDTAPAEMFSGESADLLVITADHRGRAGDTDIELVTIDLLFEELAGDPLTSGEANALIENLHLYADDGSGQFDGPDTLVATVDTLSLAAGVQTIVLADGNPDLRIGWDAPGSWFVVVDLTGDAARQTPHQFQVTHLTETTSTAEDVEHDLPVSLEFSANESSTLVVVQPGVPEITQISLSSEIVDEGGSTTLRGEFTDTDLTDIHTVTVDWGDGDTTELTLTEGVRTFSIDHLYRDDEPATGTSSDLLEILVTLNDDTGLFDQETTRVTVNNVAPTIDEIEFNNNPINESQSVTVSGRFSDPALGVATESFAGTAVWSDGEETVVSVDGSQGTFSTSRSFPDDHPQSGTPSDEFTVTVTISDDDSGSDSITSSELTVNNVDPIIESFSSDATFENKAEEGGLVTVRGAFTDVGLPDVHTAVVNWGDGTEESATVSQGAGSGEIQANHRYAHGGIYTITVTLTDDDTGSAQTTTTAVVTGVGINEGVLYIIGTSAQDTVTVNRVGQDRTRVRASFTPERYRTFQSGEFDEIVSHLCEGDDRLRISKRVTQPAIVDGGAGDDRLRAGGGETLLIGGVGSDRLIGGRGSAVLVGGDGADRLIGRRGDDLLIGGTGSDRLTGRRGDDALVGGSTNIDDDEALLLEALRAWTSSDAYQDRVDELALLVAVTDDGNPDRLSGRTSRDLFFAGLGDLLTDVRQDETVL